jgi:hypothetical protein
MMNLLQIDMYETTKLEVIVKTGMFSLHSNREILKPIV